MPCYKDVTYCTSSRCKNESCSRRLTEEASKEAEDIGLLISYSDLRRVCSAYWDGVHRNEHGVVVE